MNSAIQHLPLVKSKFFLHQKYVVEGLNPGQIAELTFSSRQTVVKHLLLSEIPIRDEDRGHKQLCFGKQWRNQRLVDKSREQAVIEKMLALREQGYSYEKIADILNAMQIKTKTRRSKWYAKTVRQVITRAI